MATNYRASLKTTRMQSVADDIDSGGGPGYIEICTAGYATVLATIVLDDPCGVVSGDTLTFADFPRSDLNPAATGTPAVARIKESGGAVVVNGLTVGTSGADIIVASPSIVAGVEFELLSASIQHAA